jgi:hypothetical protein
MAKDDQPDIDMPFITSIVDKLEGRLGRVDGFDTQRFAAEMRKLIAAHPCTVVTAQGPDHEGRISCMLRTSEFRGDHGADVSQAQRIKPGETVTSLVFRLIKERRQPHSYEADPANDVIELRRIQEP